VTWHSVIGWVVPSVSQKCNAFTFKAPVVQGVLDCFRNIRTRPGTQLHFPKEILPWGPQGSQILLLRVINFYYWRSSVTVFHYHYWCHIALHYMWFIWKYIWLQHWSFLSKTFIWYLLKSSSMCFNSSSALPFASSSSHVSDKHMCKLTMKNFPFMINCFIFH